MLTTLTRRQRDRNRQRQAGAVLAADNTAVSEALLADAEAHRQHIEHVAFGDRETQDHSVETVWVHSLQDFCPCSKTGDHLVHGAVRPRELRKMGRVEVGADLDPHMGWDLVDGVEVHWRRGWFRDRRVGAYLVLGSVLRKQGCLVGEGGEGRGEQNKQTNKKKETKGHSYAIANHNVDHLPSIIWLIDLNLERKQLGQGALELWSGTGDQCTLSAHG